MNPEDDRAQFNRDVLKTSVVLAIFMLAGQLAIVLARPGRTFQAILWSGAFVVMDF